MPSTGSAPVALIIDDDAMMRLLLRETLKTEGFTILEADNGKDGLNLCFSRKPDLILLDVVMPEMDGFSVCQSIRKHFAGVKQIPILIMTGLDDIDSINYAYELGATDFVTKPINWTILGYRTRYILRASQDFEKLLKSQEALAKAQELAKLGIWDFHIDSGKMRGSEVMYRIIGRSCPDTLVEFDDFLTLLQTKDSAAIRTAFEAARGGILPINMEFRISSPEGEDRIIHGQSDDQIKSGWLSGTFQDITERRRAEEKISYLSFYDGLTGLANRFLFKEILGKSMSKAKRHNYKLVGIFLDLDKFQRINDIFGPSSGDSLLKLVAERLVEAVRESDLIARLATPGDRANAEIARLGGDEFSILLTGIRQVEDAARVACRILNFLSTPFTLHDQEVFVTASAGITVYPDDASDVDSFMKNGDTVLHYAKEKGRNNYQFYSRSLNSTAFQKLSLENSLRHAVEHQELVLHYQPKIDALSGAMVGVEALLRWKHPEMGMVSPAEFIPIAEESGLIIPIGEAVLRATCRQIRAWRENGQGYFSVAVNLAAHHFQQHDFCKQVSQIIQEEQIDANFLEIELTESMLMDDVENTILKMHQLKDIGVKLSIDDFGTGYSSLNYLMRFPIDTLKIDMSFIRSIPHDNSHVAITTAIIAMAQNLRLSVVAEGVENETQVTWLKTNGCNILQGYYFSRPVPPDELVEFYGKTPVSV